MPEGRPYSSREADEATAMIEAGERTRVIPGVPRELAAGIAHALYAAAAELNNGRPLPIEVRRAARHLVRAVDQLAPRQAE